MKEAEWERTVAQNGDPWYGTQCGVNLPPAPEPRVNWMRADNQPPTSPTTVIEPPKD